MDRQFLRTRTAKFVILLIVLAAAPYCQAMIDLDSDGLDDVWEEFFGAQSVLPDGDEDNDGKTNQEECVAGTDPFDGGDCFQIDDRTLTDTTATLTIPTKRGKCYQVEVSDNLSTWNFEGTEIYGTGDEITINLSGSAATGVDGSVTQEIWVGISGSDVPALTGAGAYPSNPDGIRSLPGLELPRNRDDDYGGRIRGFIKPEVTGHYTFYIASRGHSELYLSTDQNPANAGSRVAWVESDILQPREWDHFSTQQHGPVLLNSDQKYYIEVLHKHDDQEDHCAVGWEGTDLDNGSIFGGIAVVDSAYLCPWIESPATATDFDGGNKIFTRVTVKERDQDGDGLSDWAETEMGGDGGFSPFDSTSTSSGASDGATVTAALGAASESIEVIASDDSVFEDPRGSADVSNGTPIQDVERDVARFRIARTGSLRSVVVAFSLGGVPLPDESADLSDYSAMDGEGNPLNGTVTIPFGHSGADVVIAATNDGVHEYPETLRCAVVAGSGYDVGANDFADCHVYDAQDIPEQETLLVGSFSQDDKAVVPSVGNGFVSARVNGGKNQVRIWNQFNNLTSIQVDSHVHKSNAGPSAGPIIYEITNVPGESISEPFIGELGGYPWDIVFSGGLTAQRQIDSLFAQNGESPMYLNIHTGDNQAGEIWAFLEPAGGSIDPPDPPTQGDIGYPLPLLSGNDLERDIWRFLDQATFGAKMGEVAAIKAAIEDARTNPANPDFDPNYSRITEFAKWIDAQATLDQTWLLDYTIAADFMEWKMRGFYSATHFQPFTLNSGGSNQRTIGTPPEPGVYPMIDRSNPDPELWIPTGPYPLGPDEITVGSSGSYNGLGDVDHDNRRRGLFTLMLNARDQLRQKMGYALQQVNVVSEELDEIEDYHLGAANYQDQLNYHAFGKYRDVIDWVVWSPQMGSYLSSLKNQRAIYDDNDTPGDTSDDFALFSPDENLAREVMQLFTIGLFELHLNGDLKLSGATGLPAPTYNIDHITELSRILTGQSFSHYVNDPDGTANTQLEENDLWHTPLVNDNFNRNPANKYIDWAYNRRMGMFPDRHDNGVDHFTGAADPFDIAGGRSINNTGLGLSDQERSVKDVSDSLDWFAGVLDGNTLNDFTGDPNNPASSHASTPAFIAYRLIQRFITSNPSADYVYHVAKAFRDGFDSDFDGGVDVAGGGEGDLGAAIKTILLHPEARDLVTASLDRHGKKLTALEAEFKLIRTMEAHSHLQIEDRADPGFPPVTTPAPDYPGAAEFASYGYPATQADNFEMDCVFRFRETDSSSSDSLTISPFKEATVFSFQLPHYAPNDVALAGLVAPEMELVSELTVIQNINYLENLARNYPSGQSLEGMEDEIGVFANEGPYDNSTVDNVRIPMEHWIAPVASGGRGLYPDSSFGSELDRDKELIRRLDMMLMAGRLHSNYTYDHSDDDVDPDPGDPDIDAPGPNPLEIIVDLVVANESTPADPPGSDSRPREKLKDALWLIQQCSDFVVRK